MSIPTVIVRIVSISLIVLSAGIVCGETTSTGSGQAFPSRPIRIVTSPPGGGSDFASRQIAQGISGPLGQPVIVENRPSGIIPAEIVARSSPDGYTLLVIGTNFWVGPLLQKMPYDVMRDYAPISLLLTAANAVAVHPAVAAKSVKEFIALARARPGELNYASGPAGSSNHLATELFKSMAGINITRVSYKGGAAAMSAVIGGEVQLMINDVAVITPHVTSGKLRALAVTTAQPTPLLPGVPTVTASGVPGYDAVGITGIFAPAKTPAAIVNRLNQEIVRVLNQADLKEKFLNLGIEVVGSSPTQFAATVKTEITKWGKLIKDTGIKAD